MPRATKKNLGRKKNTKTRRNRKKKGGMVNDEMIERRYKGIKLLKEEGWAKPYDPTQLCFQDVVLTIVQNGEHKVNIPITKQDKGWFNEKTEVFEYYVAFDRVKTKSENHGENKVSHGGDGNWTRVKKGFSKIKKLGKTVTSSAAAIGTGISKFGKGAYQYTFESKYMSVFLKPIITGRVMFEPNTKYNCVKQIQEQVVNNSDGKYTYTEPTTTVYEIIKRNTIITNEDSIKKANYSKYNPKQDNAFENKILHKLSGYTDQYDKDKKLIKVSDIDISIHKEDPNNLAGKIKPIYKNFVLKTADNTFYAGSGLKVVKDTLNFVKGNNLYQNKTQKLMDNNPQFIRFQTDMDKTFKLVKTIDSSGNNDFKIQKITSDDLADMVKPLKLEPNDVRILDDVLEKVRKEDSKMEKGEDNSESSADRKGDSNDNPF